MKCSRRCAPRSLRGLALGRREAAGAVGQRGERGLGSLAAEGGPRGGSRPGPRVPEGSAAPRGPGKRLASGLGTSSSRGCFPAAAGAGTPGASFVLWAVKERLGLVSLPCSGAGASGELGTRPACALFCLQMKNHAPRGADPGRARSARAGAPARAPAPPVCLQTPAAFCRVAVGRRLRARWELPGGALRSGLVCCHWAPCYVDVVQSPLPCAKVTPEAGSGPQQRARTPPALPFMPFLLA